MIKRVKTYFRESNGAGIGLNLTIELARVSVEQPAHEMANWCHAQQDVSRHYFKVTEVIMSGSIFFFIFFLNKTRQSNIRCTVKKTPNRH